MTKEQFTDFVTDDSLLCDPNNGIQSIYGEKREPASVDNCTSLVTLRAAPWKVNIPRRKLKEANEMNGIAWNKPKLTGKYMPVACVLPHHNAKWNCRHNALNKQTCCMHSLNLGFSIHLCVSVCVCEMSTCSHSFSPLENSHEAALNYLYCLLNK